MYALYFYTDNGLLEFQGLYETKKELYFEIDLLQNRGIDTYYEWED